MTDRSDDRGEAARYAVVSGRVGSLYEQEEYDAALAVIDAERAALPTYLSDLAHLAACLHARAGNPAAGGRGGGELSGVGPQDHDLVEDGQQPCQLGPRLLHGEQRHDGSLPRRSLPRVGRRA